MSQPLLEYFAKWIETEPGIVYSADNYFQLQNRIDEILQSKKIKSIEELVEIVRKGPDSSLRQLIIDVVTNNETLFFRDPKVFHGFRHYLIPQVLEKKPADRPVRIWSAASHPHCDCW